MKRWIGMFLSVMLIFSLSACGRQTQQSSGREGNEGSSANSGIAKNSETEAEAGSDGNASTTGARVLIAYFTVPEDVKASENDAVSGASVVVKDGERMGNTQYVAGLVQKTVGGDLFQIEARDAYPLEHEALVDKAAEEQDRELRPELVNQVENMEQYDTIILGYPNWWADLPMPVYTFLEEYDFSGKTIIPFVTHGGSGFSGTINTISKLQPNAQVSDNTLSLSRNDVANAEDEIRQWAEGLGVK